MKVLTLSQVLRAKTGLSVSVNEAIAAIVIGVIVLGGAGFGIAAGYNYSQDTEARATLSAVKSSQVKYEAKRGEYGTVEELTSGSHPTLTKGVDGLVVQVTNDGAEYCATLKSKSMQGPQFIVGTRGEVSEVRTSFDPKTLKGCQTQSPIFVEKHGETPLAAVPVPEGATKTCLRFSAAPGKDVTNWYVGVKYLDAEKKPTPNSAMPNGAGGYLSNGAMRTLAIDGYCFAISPDIKFVRWQFNSSTADTYGPGGLNTLGTRYTDIFVLFH